MGVGRGWANSIGCGGSVSVRVGSRSTSTTGSSVSRRFSSRQIGFDSRCVTSMTRSGAGLFSATGWATSGFPKTSVKLQKIRNSRCKPALRMTANCSERLSRPGRTRCSATRAETSNAGKLTSTAHIHGPRSRLTEAPAAIAAVRQRASDTGQNCSSNGAV